MSPQVEKITFMLRKLMVKAGMFRNDMRTFNDLLNIANGSSLIKNESSLEFSFSKKNKFSSVVRTH